MSHPRVAPWRTGLEGRPELPVPPARMPLADRGRPLKRWRWVGVFADELLLCAAVAHVGPLAVSWWAAWDRGAGRLVERTARRAGPVDLRDGRVRIDRRELTADLELEEHAGVETISPHGRSYIWTRKQGGIRVTGTATVAGRRVALDARAVVDDSAGYHARRTAWRWSAGVGTAADGTPVAWNLVDGLHDDRERSERTVWVGGTPHHVPPQPFAEDLTAVGDLRFTAEAARSRREELLLVASDYEQPFGRFTGALPVAGALRDGLGVMERHRARW